MAPFSSPASEHQFMLRVAALLDRNQEQLEKRLVVWMRQQEDMIRELLVEHHHHTHLPQASSPKPDFDFEGDEAEVIPKTKEITLMAQLNSSEEFENPAITSQMLRSVSTLSLISPTPSERRRPRDTCFHIEATISPEQRRQCVYALEDHSQRNSAVLIRKVAWRTRLAETFDSASVELMVGILIFFNAVLIGLQADYSARHAVDDKPLYFIIAEMAFACLFVVELVLRMVAHGSHFFFGHNWSWNLFDAFVISLSTTEAVLLVVVMGNNLSSGVTSLRLLRILRVLRLVRALKVVRMVHFLHALRHLILSIIFTLRALMWSMILLLMIVYTFAVLFTQVAIEATMEASDPTLVEELKTSWGSMPRSMLTLFQTITSGVDWGDAVAPLQSVNDLWLCLFIFYISFCLFAVLNVITSVFCQSAIESGQLDLDAVIYNQLKNKSDYIQRIQHLFTVLDSDCSGCLTAAEFKKNFRNNCIQAYLAGLSLEAYDPDALFRLIDIDGDGFVTSADFAAGCYKLRGPAQSLELAKVLLRISDLEDSVREAVSRSSCTSSHACCSCTNRDQRNSARDKSLDSVGSEPHVCANNTAGRTCENTAHGLDGFWSRPSENVNVKEKVPPTASPEVVPVPTQKEELRSAATASGCTPAAVAEPENNQHGVSGDIASGAGCRRIANLLHSPTRPTKLGAGPAYSETCLADLQDCRGDSSLNSVTDEFMTDGESGRQSGIDGSSCSTTPAPGMSEEATIDYTMALSVCGSKWRLPCGR
eukprot:NODE_510_length_2979_cov_5.282609.p1 GENE.NODE_510_length_2979_cov_5.282609~~NODE_510_length_2979_cov_5.282609.p1  ORF type:complete len:886 (-),score=202.48 NODE_510_length_2979_cov_5.282609:321-2612(-)